MAADPSLNHYGISWHDSAWIPILTPENVLEYFSQRTNPFYDRTCNNEMIKMQRLDMSQLTMMQGLEYILLHVQNPILFVIRKQHRHSPTQVTPLADYYILAGVVYQCPDLGSLINSRMLSVLHNLTAAFDEAFSYARYHPSKGYWWEFKDGENKAERDIKKKSNKDNSRTAASSLFQRQHVDLLLEELFKKFPPQRVKFPGNAVENVATESLKDVKEPAVKIEAITNVQSLRQSEQNRSPEKRSLSNVETVETPETKPSTVKKRK
ncbi:mediator of RNA polymerase II transcription subunit 6-like [Xenia sp. Carnegie-2017]|uniref:mediator of RNA polymerase II transcription subunit 6-like n=1 Tax=Xenia sp. Carnegie-2017 TaxID=2897299 RepID=UPI001F045891|nr:mediator of RNA polymerase II transcription subunit 6-like [Xenia sp. Carnegie-2017]